MGRLERRTEEELRRLRALEESVVDIEGDVEVNLNTTAFLENKMLVMERDGERDQFERQVIFDEMVELTIALQELVCSHLQVMRSLQNLNSTLRILEDAIEEQQVTHTLMTITNLTHQINLCFH